MPLTPARGNPLASTVPGFQCGVDLIGGCDNLKRSNGCINARVRDDNETGVVVVPPNLVSIYVVIVEDDNRDDGESDDNERSAFVEGPWLRVTPVFGVLREMVAEEEQLTSNPDSAPDSDDLEAEAVFPAEDRRRAATTPEAMNVWQEKMSTCCR